MDLLYIWHDYYTHYYRYWYRILFSTIPTLWPRGQGHELRNFMLKFCLKVFKILYLNSWISNQNSIHLAYIWYTASYWRCSSSKIICSTMSSSPLPTLPTPNTSGIILMVIYKLFSFYLIDKREFRQAILPGDSSCSAWQGLRVKNSQADRTVCAVPEKTYCIWPNYCTVRLVVFFLNL